MKKKVLESADNALDIEQVPFMKPKVGKLDLDFGREDLNKLKDKVNEIIDSL